MSAQDFVHSQPMLLHLYGTTRTFLHKHILPHGEFGATELIPGKLYLGSIWDSHNKPALLDRNIKSILTIATSVSPSWPETFNYMSLEASDTETENILPSYFNDTNAFISSVVDNNSNDDAILVHCMQGRSRSVTLVIAYLMKYREYSVDDAIQFVREKRPIAGPNEGFIKQLRKYEQIIKEEKK